MGRILMMVLGAVLLLGLGGVLLLGAFPPKPHPEPVQLVLPNDRFQPH